MDYLALSGVNKDLEFLGSSSIPPTSLPSPWRTQFRSGPESGWVGSSIRKAKPNINIYRIRCQESQAAGMVEKFANSLRLRGLQIVYVGSAWKHGKAVIAVHSVGRQKVPEEVDPRVVQMAHHPELFALAEVA